eukprot:764837-Hanusia_phi.AAC.6
MSCNVALQAVSAVRHTHFAAELLVLGVLDLKNAGEKQESLVSKKHPTEARRGRFGLRTLFLFAPRRITIAGCLGVSCT